MLSAKQRWIFIFLTMLLSITVALPVRAQTATPPTPRDVLIQAITEQAQRDEQKGVQESTEGLNLLFGEQAKQVGMTLPEVKKIYEEAYSAAAAGRPWQEKLLKDLWPNLGWVAALIAIVIALFQEKLRNGINKLLDTLGEALYNRFAGYKPFWMLALRRYKAALYEKHHELKLPFRPGRPLEMKEVYVPVKVSGKGADTLTDAYQAIEKHKKLVVLGAPGAGKSILLRHVALTYAERDLDEPLVPVLVELNRLNDAGTKMFDQIVALLKQNNFPNGENFLKAWLKTGQLLLMFDGLDEVNTDRREQVSAGIRDLLAEYPGCHAIVTCRTQVYKGEFADWADQTLEVAEFSDQQIQRFLFAWQKELPQIGKSIAQLARSLSERPQIMALARNPLMLTIIAFLYADTEFVLPHSRAEFYDTAVTVLLEQWKEKRNRYKAASKRLVMQHLALFMQDIAAERGQERRTIDRSMLLDEIRKILPALNLKADEAQPLLDEIIFRSGLMIALDHGLKYQFTHLTLQEFFAAQSLAQDAEALLQRFKSEPDVWRETLKIWCALEHDSTQLLRKLYVLDALTTFECLVDAQKVDPEFSNQLIDEFQKHLLDGDVNERMLHTFAILASDLRPRGQNVLQVLINLVENKNARSLFINSASILAMTNLPQAATALSKHIEDPDIKTYLSQMGDVAIPILSFLAQEQKSLDAAYVIGTIDTPLAQSTLAKLAFLIEQKPDLLNIIIDGPSAFDVKSEAIIRLSISNLGSKLVKNIDVKLEKTAAYSCLDECCVNIHDLRPGKSILVEFKIKACSSETEALLLLKINNELYNQNILKIFFFTEHPYILGNPVQNKETFFGRYEEINRVLGNCASSNGTHTMIIGEQRSGKTSLINQVFTRLSPPFIPLFISFGAMEREHPKDAAEWLLDQIVNGLKKQKCIPENYVISELKYTSDFKDRFEDVIEKVLEYRNDQCRLILFLDEGQIISEIDVKFQEVLRETFSKLVLQVRVVFACYYDFLADLRSSGSALPNIFEHIYLKPLDGEDLKKLIMIPAKRVGKSFDSISVDEIISLSGGHPFYCQSLCANSYRLAAGSSVITLENVRDAEKRVLRDELEKFKLGYWSRLKPNEKLFLGALATSTIEHAVDKQVTNRLKEKGS